MKGIIFDLDQTLVDTKPVKQLRENRQWNLIYPKVKYLKPYNGILEIINLLHINDIKLSVVTNSPRPYCERILDYWNFNIDNLVCFHDVKNRKPNKEPIEKAINLMEVNKNNVLSIGDDKNDIIASNNSGVISIASMWDPSSSYEEIKGSSPNYICKDVYELKNLLKDLNYI